MSETPTPHTTDNARRQAYLYEMGKTYPRLGKLVGIRSNHIDVAGFNRERLYFFKDKHGTISMIPQELTLTNL